MREETRRLSICEIQIVELKRRLRELGDILARAEGMISQLPGTTGGGGGGSQHGWCESPGFAAATGTWPSITPSSGSADVYQGTSGALSLVATAATIHWWYKDASVAGKLVAVEPNTDGSWDAIVDSCTAI
jgi:hypothetical protein